ncbi:MAG: VWA domain-containing protein [Promethearchaeota archaeon]
MLRSCDLQVCPSAIIEAQKVLLLQEFIQNPENLRFALGSILAKQLDEKERFNFCFDLFFLGENRFLKTEHPSEDSSLEVNFKDNNLQTTSNAIDSGFGGSIGVSGEGSSGSGTTQSLAPSSVRQEFLRWVSERNRYYANQILNDPNQAGQSIAQNFREEYSDPKTIGKRMRALETDLKRALRMVEDGAPIVSMNDKRIYDLISSSIERAIRDAKIYIVRSETFDKEEMLYAFFWTDEERENVLDQEFREIRVHIDEIKHELTRLGRKLASKERIRRRNEKRGKIDFRRTIRWNLSTGGIPIDLKYRKRRVEDPELLLLNDVSGSTEWISEWFFVVAYAAQKAFHRIRLFEFDSRAVEVTEALKETNLAKALKDRSHPWKNVITDGHSNYHSSFREFLAIAESSITKKTTILILGDCRDWLGMWRVDPRNELGRGIPYSAEVMARIVKKAKSVIIMNPEPPRAWNVGDSVVEHYISAGAKVFHVNNLRKLSQLVFFPKGKLASS